MKRIFTLVAGLLIVVAIFSQTPQRISYQAVIRDNTNQLVASQQVGMRISILWGSADGMVVYSEAMAPETNSNGLASIEIGGEAGFSSIDWSAGPYFIKTETDPSGGIDYTIAGISQLLTVPYALHARTAENISGDISVDYSELTGTPVLSTVAESGNYNDLTGTPDLSNVATSGSFNDLGGRPSTLSGYGITDAMSTSHSANGISSVDITSWNAAYLWGDHSVVGYLTSESDPVFTSWDKTTGITITESQIGDLKTYLTSEADPVFSSHVASSIVSAGSGNVISMEERIKLTGIEAEANKYVHPVTHPASMVVEETNLRFMTDAERAKLAAVEAEANKYVHPGTHPASMVVEEENLRFMTDAERAKLEGIETGAQLNVKADWNALVGSEAEILNRPVLANVATSGSFNDLGDRPSTLSGYGITDAMSTLHAANGISAVDITSWNAAHLWGDHSAKGYLTSELDPVFTTWDKTTGITITESQISDLKPYLSAESDPAVAANFDFSTADIGDLLMFNGTKWVKHTPDYAASIHTHGQSTIAADGFMSAADKTRLDGLQNSDGSETNIIAGENIAVSGTGTTSDPYVVNVDTGTRYIGEEYGGGIVFYVTPDGKHGLIAAKQDQTLSGSSNWYNAQNVISNPANHDVEGKNYTDWRLPTLHELQLLHGQRLVVGGFIIDRYWTSTESLYDRSFVITFYATYTTSIEFKNYNPGFKIRSIRSF